MLYSMTNTRPTVAYADTQSPWLQKETDTSWVLRRRKKLQEIASEHDQLSNQPRTRIQRVIAEEKGKRKPETRKRRFEMKRWIVLKRLICHTACSQIANQDTQTNHFIVAGKLRSSDKRSSKHVISTHELDTTELQLSSQPDHKKPQSPQGRWCSRTPFKKPAQKGRYPLTPLFS